MTARPRTAPAVVRRALAVLSVLFVAVLASSIVHAGTRYFYCSAMQQLRADSCCGMARAHDAEDEDRSDPAPQATPADPDCCHAEALPALPDGAAGELPAPLAAPLLAVLSPLALFDAPATPPLTTRAPLTRSLAPPLYASEARARLMVFLS